MHEKRQNPVRLRGWNDDERHGEAANRPRPRDATDNRIKSQMQNCACPEPHKDWPTQKSTDQTKSGPNYWTMGKVSVVMMGALINEEKPKHVKIRCHTPDKKRPEECIGGSIS